MEGKILAVFFAVSTLSLALVSCESSTYVGAVVEYHPITAEKEQDAVDQNVAAYKEFMKQAKDKGADIIVFPEYGLGARKILTVVPHPARKIAPCEDPKTESKILKDLSQASKDNKIYSVVNLLEKRTCEKGDENCPSTGFYKFNTNVVFDRSGVIVARYAKHNLYDEHLTDRPEVEISIFDTDFGVRFGTFTCFDVLFGQPAQQLVEQYGITDFVFPTHWFSELPFLSALQTQRGWAETHNVNLLSSGISDPSTGSGGSGIYNGKFGSLVEIMAEKKVRKLLVATIPKINRGNEKSLKRDKREATEVFEKVVDSSPASEVVSQPKGEPTLEEFNFLSDKMSLYNSEVVKTGQVFEKKVCSHDDFCCSFKVNAITLKPEANNYTYRAVAFNGVRAYGESYFGGVQVCGVILCNGPHISNCTTRVREIPDLFKFHEIEIRGSNFRLHNAFQMPSTLSDGNKVRPLPANRYIFERTANDKKSADVSLELIWPVTDLHTFGIYGRDYIKDNQTPPIAAASFATSLPALLATFVAYILFFH